MTTYKYQAVNLFTRDFLLTCFFFLRLLQSRGERRGSLSDESYISADDHEHLTPKLKVYRLVSSPHLCLISSFEKLQELTLNVQ